MAIEDSVDVEPARPTKSTKQAKKPTHTRADDDEPLTPREKRLQAKVDLVRIRLPAPGRTATS